MTLSYSTTATAWGGRMGRVATSDGKLDYRLSMPESMGGEGGEGTNPEQLFATGYAACFHNAVRSVARTLRVDVTDSAVSSPSPSPALSPTGTGCPSGSRLVLVES
jgi:osmotically inducible protein OsmC